MELFTYKITGISPILMNNPAAMAKPNGKKLATKQIPTPEEEAAAKVYRTESGQLYIPAVAFRSSIIGVRGGGSGKKIGKVAANNCVAAGAFTIETECPLYDPDTGEEIHEYEIHSCRAVVQRAGVIRSRPMIKRWGCDVVFEIDQDYITAQMMEELLNASGKVAGVMDYRPQCKGPFGRYSAEMK